MKPVIVPHYYTRFACIAGECRHTCCVGWEIDIDEAALARYKTIPGVIGDRIRASIDLSEGGSPCFRLTSDERCPHLASDGLCDIISALGKEALCGICRDHPRFRNHLPDAIELGLGLCCEAACALILDDEEPLHLVTLQEPQATHEHVIAATQEEETDETNAEDAIILRELRAVRSVLLTILGDRSRTLGERIGALSARVGGLYLPDMNFLAWADFLRRLERLDPAWDKYLDALEDAPPLGESILSAELTEQTHVAYEHLIGYFIYRYMTASDDLDLPDVAAVRVSFAVVATALIHTLVRVTGADVHDVARMFSSEIEYSDENREAFLDLLAFGVD